VASAVLANLLEIRTPAWDRGWLRRAGWLAVVVVFVGALLVGVWELAQRRLGQAAMDGAVVLSTLLIEPAYGRPRRPWGTLKRRLARWGRLWLGRVNDRCGVCGGLIRPHSRDGWVHVDLTGARAAREHNHPATRADRRTAHLWDQQAIALSREICDLYADGGWGGPIDPPMYTRWIAYLGTHTFGRPVASGSGLRVSEFAQRGQDDQPDRPGWVVYFAGHGPTKDGVPRLAAYLHGHPSVDNPAILLIFDNILGIGPDHAGERSVIGGYTSVEERDADLERLAQLPGAEQIGAALAAHSATRSYDTDLWAEAAQVAEATHIADVLVAMTDPVEPARGWFHRDVHGEWVYDTQALAALRTIGVPGDDLAAGALAQWPDTTTPHAQNGEPR
jgi:hypothetical protein